MIAMTSDFSVDFNLFVFLNSLVFTLRVYPSLHIVTFIIIIIIYYFILSNHPYISYSCAKSFTKVHTVFLYNGYYAVLI